VKNSSLSHVWLVFRPIDKEIGVHMLLRATATAQPPCGCICYHHLIMWMWSQSCDEMVSAWLSQYRFYIRPYWSYLPSYVGQYDQHGRLWKRYGKSHSLTSRYAISTSHIVNSFFTCPSRTLFLPRWYRVYTAAPLSTTHSPGFILIYSAWCFASHFWGVVV
jgi:hypothetical protein